MEKKECIWSVAPEERHCEYCTFRCRRRFELQEADGASMALYEKYRAIMHEVANVEIKSKCRVRTVVYCRYFVVDQMYKDGVSPYDIAKCVGLDRTTTIHARKMVKFVLEFKHMFLKENRIYEEFIKKIKNG